MKNILFFCAILCYSMAFANPTDNFSEAPLSCTVSDASTTPEVCINTPLTTITHTTTGATGIDEPQNLPSGLTATWDTDMISIEGTPTESGVFEYVIPLLGDCDGLEATGTITVSITEITDFVSAGEICAGEDAEYYVQGTPEATVTYTIDGGAELTEQIGADGSLIISVSEPTTDVIFNLLRVTGINGCETTIDLTDTVTYYPAIVTGEISVNQTICPNTNPGDVSLTGFVGTIVGWEVSTDDSFIPSTTITETSATLSGAQIGALTDTHYIRAVLSSGACGDGYSPVHLISADLIAPESEGSLEALNVQGCTASDAPEAYTAASQFALLGVSLEDNFTARVDLVITYSDVPTVDPNCPNEIEVTRTYEVADSCGNTVEVPQTIFIKNTEPPTVPEDVTEEVSEEALAIQPTAPVVTDHCGNSLTAVITNNADEAEIDEFCQKEVIYTYTYTDCGGNESVYTYTYIVNRAVDHGIDDVYIEACDFSKIDGFDLAAAAGYVTEEYEWIPEDHEYVTIDGLGIDDEGSGQGTILHYNLFNQREYEETDETSPNYDPDFVIKPEVFRYKVYPIGDLGCKDVPFNVDIEVPPNNLRLEIQISVLAPPEGFSYNQVGEPVYFEILVQNLSGFPVHDVSIEGVINEDEEDEEALSELENIRVERDDDVIQTSVDIMGHRNEPVRFLAERPLTQEDINSGSLSAQVQVFAFDSCKRPTGGGKGGRPVDILESDPDVTFEIEQISDIELKKVGLFNDENEDGIVQPGETITYSFDVKNHGNVTLSDIQVHDDMIVVQGLPLVLNSLENNGTEFFGTYTITQEDVDNGSVTNTATVTATDVNGEILEDVSDDPDSDEAGSSTPTILNIVQVPQLSLTQVVDRSYFGEVGDELTYTIIATNTGNVTLEDVTLTSVDGVLDGDANIGTLASGESYTFTAVHTIEQADIDAGSFVSTSEVTGNFVAQGITVTEDSDDLDDLTDQDIDVDGDPEDPTISLYEDRSDDLVLLKTAVFNDEDNDGYPLAGETITYTFSITNNGVRDLTNVSIEDDKVTIEGDPITLLAGESSTDHFTATYTILQDDIDNEEVRNTATVLAVDAVNYTYSDISDDPNDPTDVDTNENGDPDDPTVVVLEKFAKLEVLKEVNVWYFDELGDVLTYEITVTNKGNTYLTDVNITDPNTIITSATSIDQLDPAATYIFTASHEITEEDMEAEIYVNTAIIEATSVDLGITFQEDSDDPDVDTDVDTDNDGDPEDPTVSVFDNDKDDDGQIDTEDNDDDNDGIPDELETGPNGEERDTDGDGVPDSFDEDSDNDGLFDYTEVGHDGKDLDGDGRVDTPITPGYVILDTDADGIYNFLDDDDDDDGILTIDENADPNGNNIPEDALDSNGDGVPDYLDRFNEESSYQDGIQVHNFITRNGDDTNRRMIIDGLEEFVNEVIIFNRWGDEVFRTEDYGVNENYFEGYSQSSTVGGEALPAGTYYYIINYVIYDQRKQLLGYLYIN